MTDEEKKKLEDLKKNISSAADTIGSAIAEGSSVLAKVAVRSVKEWAVEMEKFFDEKPKEGKKP